MEWWSDGVMKGLIQYESEVMAFSNTPILHYSITPKALVIFTGKSIETRPPHSGIFDWAKVLGFP